MATTTKVLARTAAATSSATLYTAPNTSTLAIVTNIVLANAATSASTATVAIDGTPITTNMGLSPVAPPAPPAMPALPIVAHFATPFVEAGAITNISGGTASA